MKRLYPLLFISVLIYWGCEGTTKCKIVLNYLTHNFPLLN